MTTDINILIEALKSIAGHSKEFADIEDAETMLERIEQKAKSALEDYKPTKQQVVISVMGGVADIESCPDDIEVTINDYDNQE